MNAIYGEKYRNLQIFLMLHKLHYVTKNPVTVFKLAKSYFVLLGRTLCIMFVIRHNLFHRNQKLDIKSLKSIIGCLEVAQIFLSGWVGWSGVGWAKNRASLISTWQVLNLPTGAELGKTFYADLALSSLSNF